VVSKIAAGEVIERPASVIKELLENSIDAGSRRIEIDIEQGGAERIIVVDDGCGIEPNELPLAFASHATSKLRDADDLFRVGTLGFRGEALCSIGGVAQVTIQSRTHDRDCGAEIHCHGGELSTPRPWNGAPGTRIEVKHLFYNTPVRRKFLKTVSTELGHITETVTRLALAHPGLQIALRHNGKLVTEVPATSVLADRIRLFFGAQVRDALLAVNVERGPAKLHGYIADPKCDRGNPRMQYLFLNGRWIRDRSLGHAIQEGFRGLLMTGRYAVAFLFIELPPDAVDVNVHPTKAEVRFRDSSAVFHLVLSSVRARLNEAQLIPQLQLPQQFPPPSNPDDGRVDAAPDEEFAFPVAPPPAYDPRVFQPPESMPVRPVPPAANGLPPSKAIQIHDSYLVLETREGMLVIDQHALHERILFEQFKRRLQDGPMERQRLLVPEPVDLSAEQAALALAARIELAELGLEIEDFGAGTVVVHSYPTLLAKLTPAEILREAVDFLTAQDRPPTREILLNDLMSLMACKAAVKAGDRLTPEQLDALLAQRHLAQDAHHCPHGRPTSLIFSRKELDKQFGRT
jgi:DNA mismatch repair protein MutL